MMADAENFLHTTHRTVSWFNKAFHNDELVLAAPFQRNPVWTDLQKAYLIDTILHGLPIPELYMQDVGDEAGQEKHIVVDGQQRIRAALDFVHGQFALEGDEVKKAWRGLKFEDLNSDEKKKVFGYKFVVRILPPMDEEGVRRIFSRLNRNVVSLNDQELRNATYWGPFIKAIQYMADEYPFWAESGIFSANDHRRMIDHEYISELVIAYLHGPQNKKNKLDQYYQLHESSFEERDRVVATFRKVTDEIEQLLPDLKSTRWRKKSDFYTLFLELASRASELPFSKDTRAQVSAHLSEFGSRVDRLLSLEEEEWTGQDENVVGYARSVSRAASDRSNRVARSEALKKFVFAEEAIAQSIE
jgi:uncharacterized protein with ParB-like and HNH nuclease domain